VFEKAQKATPAKNSLAGGTECKDFLRDYGTKFFRAIGLKNKKEVD
jgi:hypothetical protein